MKRLVRKTRGEVNYGPKWQHTESSSDSENDDGDDDFHSPTITNQDQIPKGKRVEVTVKEGELMYGAAFQGDWMAAEVLLQRDPNLAFDYLTEEGCRALHVAAAMERTEFVKILVERMSEGELALLDGHGNTACCYAAISGNVEIAGLIIGNRPNLVTARDEENGTPLRKAALLGSREMLSFLLGYTKNEDLSREEWFDLLLVAIRRKMPGVAIDIMGKDGSIATMANDEGTALHLLARVGPLGAPISKNSWNSYILFIRGEREDALDVSKLDKMVWGEMLKLEKDSLMELMKKPVPIIHEAAKTGRVGIITMLTRSFPQLISETESEGYTILHMAVMYRQSLVFAILHQVKPMLGFRTMWQDRQGNNILHLAAAKSAAATPKKLPPAALIQWEMEWFKDVKSIVPPTCVMMRNGKGLTPEELFSKTHKKLLKKSQIWMTNRADALMLIATILLTVVFAAAFTVPGGYSSQTGEPLLGEKTWFKAFVVFEVLSIMSSIGSIIMFQSIMASSFTRDQFLIELPARQRVGFLFLLISLLWAFLAFMASISLFNLSGINVLVWFGIVVVCIYGALNWLFEEMGYMDASKRSWLGDYLIQNLFDLKTSLARA